MTGKNTAAARFRRASPAARPAWFGGIFSLLLPASAALAGGGDEPAPPAVASAEATTTVAGNVNRAAAPGVTAVLLRARSLLERHDYANVVDLLEPLRAPADPADARDETHLLLGLALFGMERLDDAQREFEAFARRRPGEPMPHEFLGRIHLQQGDYQSARTEFEEALASGADEARTSNFLGAVLLRLRESEAAVDAFRRALDADPDFAVAHYNLGILLGLLRRNSGAIDHLERAAELQPEDHDPAEALGDLFREIGSMGYAATWYAEAAARSPGLPHLWRNLGDAREGEGRLQDAEEAWRRACELDGTDPELRVRLARRLAARGSFDEARDWLLDAVALEDEPAARMRVRLELAELEEDVGRPHAGRRHLESALRRDLPEASRSGEVLELGAVLARLSRLCELEGDARAAVLHFESLCSLAPREAPVRTATEIEVIQRQIESRVSGISDPVIGLACARVLVERTNGQDPGALYLVARALAANGNESAAAAACTRAARLFSPDDPLATSLSRQAMRMLGN